MATITLLATVFIHQFVNGYDYNDTNLVWQHPIGKFNDPAATNDSDDMLGICYGSSTFWSSYPYIVQLTGSCSCSGSIIDMGSGSRPATILTAAHCQSCASTVWVGRNSPNSGGTSYSAASGSFTTWGYGSPGQFSNDIAILRLTTSLSSNTGARAVQIASNTGSNSQVNRVTGYGIDQSRSTPSQLQTGTTSFVTQNTCNSRINGVTIESNMICVQDPSNTPNNPGVTTCSGDSGGPWTGSNGVQYGVTSFGLAAQIGGCGSYQCRCCPDSPQVGANVGHFNSQICSQIGNNNPGCS